MSSLLFGKGNKNLQLVENVVAQLALLVWWNVMQTNNSVSWSLQKVTPGPCFFLPINICTCLHAAWEFRPMALVWNKAFCSFSFSSCSDTRAHWPVLLRLLLPAFLNSKGSLCQQRGHAEPPLVWRRALHLWPPSSGLIWVILGSASLHSDCHYSCGNKKHLPELRVQILTARRKREKSQHFPPKGSVRSGVPAASPP